MTHLYLLIITWRNSGRLYKKASKVGQAKRMEKTKREKDENEFFVWNCIHLFSLFNWFQKIVILKVFTSGQYWGTAHWDNTCYMPASHMNVPVQDLVVLLLIQFPDKCAWKAVENDPRSAWVPAPMWRLRSSSGLQASAWAHPSCCGHLGREPADESYLSLLSVNSAFQQEIKLYKVFILFSSFKIKVISAHIKWCALSNVKTLEKGLNSL